MPAVRRSNSLKLFWRFHRWLYQASGGRWGARLLGKPVLLLFTNGRKSGQPRTNTLYYFTSGSAYGVVASNAGSSKHPAWFLNLMAQPRTTIQVGTRQHQVRAREATGEERDRMWAKALELDKSYAQYEKWTDRLIPLILLEPMDADDPTG